MRLPLPIICRLMAVVTCALAAAMLLYEASGRFRCENAESASKIPISHSYPVMPNSFSTNFI